MTKQQRPSFGQHGGVKLDAFGRAIALANTPAEAAHIRQHLDRLAQEGKRRA